MAASHKLYVAVCMIIHIIQTVKLLPVVTPLRENKADNNSFITQPPRNLASRDGPVVEQRLQPPIQNPGQGNVHTSDQKGPFFKAASTVSDDQGAIQNPLSQLRPPVKPNMIPASEIKNKTNEDPKNVQESPANEGKSLRIQTDASQESRPNVPVDDVKNQGSKVITGTLKKLVASGDEDISGGIGLENQPNSLTQPKTNQNSMIQPVIEKGGPNVSNTGYLLPMQSLPGESTVSMQKTKIASNDGKATKMASESSKRTNQSAEPNKSDHPLKIPSQKSIPSQDSSAIDTSKASEDSELQTPERPVERALSPLGKSMELAKASQRSVANVQEVGQLGKDDADNDPAENKNSNIDLSVPKPLIFPKAAIDPIPLPKSDHEGVVNRFNVASIPGEYVFLTICLICLVILLLWKRCWYLICTFFCNRRKHPSSNASGQYKVAYKPL